LIIIKRIPAFSRYTLAQGAGETAHNRPAQPEKEHLGRE
jgi:hypothetical protein